MTALALTSNSPTETRRLGERLARRLLPGDVLLLQGDLGAGKTCLAQGIGKGLGIDATIKSSPLVAPTPTSSATMILAPATR